MYVSIYLCMCRLDQYSEEQKRQLVDCCPVGVFELDESTGSVMIANPSECIFCKECIYTSEELRKTPESKLVVDIQHSTNKFNFIVETTGSLTAKEVIKDALAVLSSKIDKLQRATHSLNN